jgi:hypothetical protein
MRALISALIFLSRPASLPAWTGWADLAAGAPGGDGTRGV